jgi:hypothetical protein
MQHQISQPLFAAQAGARRSSRSVVSISLLNGRDQRYPRARGWRVIRMLASICWLPLAALAGYAGAKTMLLALRPGATLDLPSIIGALGIDGLIGAVQEQPMLLAGAFPLAAVLVCAGMAVLWAGGDRAREAQALLLREVSPTEKANTTWMRNACLPALAWRARSLHRRRLFTGLALLLASLLLGMLIALLFAGAAIPLASLVP